MVALNKEFSQDITKICLNKLKASFCFKTFSYFHLVDHNLVD